MFVVKSLTQTRIPVAAVSTTIVELAGEHQGHLKLRINRNLNWLKPTIEELDAILLNLSYASQTIPEHWTEKVMNANVGQTTRLMNHDCNGVEIVQVNYPHDCTRWFNCKI